MAGVQPASSQAPEQALFSGRFIYKLTAAVAALALLTIAISVGGKSFGKRIALGGHTESSQEYLVEIGQDRLKLPANAIRFHEQRHSGSAERIDLYLAWPELQGYSKDLRPRFDDVSRPDSLIFLQLSQSTMSRDMSGRLEPIYTHLFEGQPQPAVAGLTLHHLRGDSGYGREVILTASRGAAPDYVVRCLLPAAGDRPTSGDCQRDIRLGQDLTVLYRFSSALLNDWQHIDAAVGSFVESGLADARTPSGQ
jgi:hypothetical protein